MYLSEEIVYWRKRNDDLTNILNQLKEDVVGQMASALEQIGSAQASTLRNLGQSVVVALGKSQEIVLYMKPLVQPLEALDASDVVEMVGQMRILVHSISLVWCTCVHFSQPEKLAHLLRQVGNAVINRCRNLLDARSIFTWQFEEAMEKIGAVQQVLRRLRHFLSDEKENIHVLIARLRHRSAATDPVSRVKVEAASWRPPEAIVFERVDRFENRLLDIVNIFNLTQQFGRLKRAEFSPMGGHSLTVQLSTINRQFSDLKSPIISGTFGDCMDPDNEPFDEYARHFLKKVALLEEKLSWIVGCSLSQSQTPANAFRIVQLVGDFLHRPTFIEQVRRNYPRIADLAHDDSVQCSELLRKTCSDHQLDIVDAVRQMIQLDERSRTNMAACQNINKSLVHNGGDTLPESYHRLQNLIRKEIAQVLTNWTCSNKNTRTSCPLFMISATGTVSSGVDANLAKMINDYRQIQHLLPSDDEIVQICRAHVFSSMWTKMKLVDMTVSCIGDVERFLVRPFTSLFEPSLRKVKQQISAGESWMCDSFDPHVDQCLQSLCQSSVHLLESIRQVQSTIDLIGGMTKSWARVLLVPLEKGLPVCSDLEDYFKRNEVHFKTSSDKISSIITQVQQSIKDSQPQSGDWCDYLESVDALIGQGLTASVASLFNNLVQRGCHDFLYTLQLNMSSAGVEFRPSLRDCQLEQGFGHKLRAFISRTLQLADAVTSLSGGAASFRESVENSDSIRALRNQLESGIDKAVESIEEKCSLFHSYRYLWQTERCQFLEDFKKYARFLADDADWTARNEASGGATFKHFRQQIQQLEQTHREIQQVLWQFQQLKKTPWIKLDVVPACKVSRLHLHNKLIDY